MSRGWWVKHQHTTCLVVALQMADSERDRAEEDQWMAGHKERCRWVSVWDEVATPCAVITGCCSVSTCNLGRCRSSVLCCYDARLSIHCFFPVFPAPSHWRRTKVHPTMMRVRGMWVTSNAPRLRRCWEANATGPSSSVRANHRRAPTPVL